MKTILSLLIGTILASSALSAAEQGSKEATSSFLSGIYAAPVGVYKIPNVHDKGQWGAGIDVGYQFNKYVSLGVVNISYAEADAWKEPGLLVDETDLKVTATLLTSENQKFQLQAICSGNRDWNNEDWGFGVGAGFAFNFSKNISLRADSQIRAWFAQEKDLLNTASIRWTF